jgi:hypothetical protein
MSDTDKTVVGEDEAKFNQTLRRMVQSPPKPHKGTGAGNTPLTDAGHKKKPGGPPAKKDHPEA